MCRFGWHYRFPVICMVISQKQYPASDGECETGWTKWKNKRNTYKCLEQEKTKLQKKMQDKDSEIKKLWDILKIVIEENKKLQQKQATVPPAQ